jgi:hypothetical protein
MKRIAGLLLSTIILLPTFPDPGNTTRVSGRCQPNQISYAASDEPEFVAVANTYANLPETAVIFTQGGASASCVIAIFSAEGFAAAGVSILIRAVMDGVTLGLPNEVRFIGESPVHYDTHTMTFIFPQVAPGSHTLRIQYLRTDDPNDRAEIGVHNLIVHHIR